MKLYCVSYEPILQLKPRVPKHRLDSEDNTTPRICCSPSIEDCLMSKPGQTEFLELCLDSGLPCILYCYSCEAAPEQPGVLCPEEVESHGVQDAVALQEYWVCDESIHWTEQVYRVLNAKFLPNMGNWLDKVVLTDQLTDTDFRLVRLAEKLNKTIHQNIPPNELFPQIWDELLVFYQTRSNG